MPKLPGTYAGSVLGAGSNALLATPGYVLKSDAEALELVVVPDEGDSNLNASDWLWLPPSIPIACSISTVCTVKHNLLIDKLLAADCNVYAASR